MKNGNLLFSDQLPPAPLRAAQIKIHASCKTSSTVLGGILSWFMNPLSRVGWFNKYLVKFYPTVRASYFSGSQVAVLENLLNGPCTSQLLSRYTGVKRVRYVVAELRKMGLVIPCTLMMLPSRGHKIGRVGVYELTASDRRAIKRWFSKMESTSLLSSRGGQKSSRVFTRSVGEVEV